MCSCCMFHRFRHRVEHAAVGLAVAGGEREAVGRELVRADAPLAEDLICLRLDRSNRRRDLVYKQYARRGTVRGRHWRGTVPVGQEVFPTPGGAHSMMLGSSECGRSSAKMSCSRFMSSLGRSGVGNSLACPWSNVS